MNLLKIYLLKVWFVMKLIKIKTGNWLYPDEVEKIKWQKYYKKR